jgi:hypothetical protein
MNRKVTAIIATAALAMLATACSGNPSSAAGGSANLPSAVAYSHCMDTHGVPDFPDPTSNGQVPKASAQQLGVSGSRLQAAERDCQHLYPANGGSVQQEEQQCYVADDCPPALVQRMMTAALKFARCMRTHGEPDFPDPTNSQGQVVFNVSAHGISDSMSHSPQFTAKLNACQRQAGNFPFGFG